MTGEWIENTLNFPFIRQEITVTIGPVWMRTSTVFIKVGQSVVISIEFGIGGIASIQVCLGFITVRQSIHISVAWITH